MRLIRDKKSANYSNQRPTHEDKIPYAENPIRPWCQDHGGIQDVFLSPVSPGIYYNTRSPSYAMHNSYALHK